eukprot:4921875-Lingulodinium_polyedra.AAC.1
MGPPTPPQRPPATLSGRGSTRRSSTIAAKVANDGNTGVVSMGRAACSWRLARKGATTAARHPTARAA